MLWALVMLHHAAATLRDYHAARLAGSRLVAGYPGKGNLPQVSKTMKIEYVRPDKRERCAAMMLQVDRSRPGCRPGSASSSRSRDGVAQVAMELCDFAAAQRLRLGGFGVAHRLTGLAAGRTASPARR